MALRPGHEAVQAAQLADQLVAGAQVKVVGVGQQDADAEFFGEVALGQALDRGLGADGHEDGGFDGSVGRVQQPGAGAGLGALGDHFERDLRQASIVMTFQRLAGRGGGRGKRRRAGCVQILIARAVGSRAGR